ncbi:MAG: 2-deoxyribose-5-phosphate aldolase, partial [Symploca sp. SIO1A3]|nr:2-deoxyribose-5-phosphate aldolase [Symploca sp. SIO1A3]
MTNDYPDIEIASLIDHALLNPTATPEQVEKCCQEADRFQFAAVCVYPTYVKQA